MIIDIHNQIDVVKNAKEWDGTIITRATGVSDRWRYMTFQNFWGNIVGGDGTGEKIYYDDVYIQIGSRARIEIGDNATWENCTHREIQIPIAWTDGSTTINVNQGSFNDSDTAYLFVVDENGTASDGYEITFGAAGETHKADTNTDGLIDMPELMAFIARWKANDNVTKSEVEDARNIWFGGGGY